MRDIFNFILHPSIQLLKEDNIRNKLIRFKNCILFSIASLFISSILIYLINFVINQFGIHPNIIDIHKKGRSLLNHYSFTQAWLLSAFIGPVLEELEFRLLLNPCRITIAISCSLFYWVHNGGSFKTETLLTANFLFLTIQSLFFASFLYYLITETVIEELKHYKYKLLVWGTILVFTFVHLKNFEPLTFPLLLLSPILLLYIFFTGWVLTYLRLRNGILWAIIFHILHNTSLNLIKGF
ncbi:CPBP family glutamic-type intramembrane protease [Solitalea agri]|uniref:CPBP family glutamic-type intramembrane protease n=1 Tax=Solitalea TaxID=929509 RepID=UPI00208F29E4|nr:CPBP family glutamic-type intramembrane protease [Solitalea agri]